MLGPLSTGGFPLLQTPGVGVISISKSVPTGTPPLSLTLQALVIDSATTIGAYDTFMQRVVVSADSNEELLTKEDVTVDVDGEQIACEKSTFKVRIGDQTGTLSTLSSAEFPWGDVGGEILADDGTLIYKAELIELGHDEMRSISSFHPTSI